MNPLVVSIIAISILLLSTTLGSGFVFLMKKNFSARTGSIIMGVASGVMLSVSIFGLLIPSMEEASLYYGDLDILPVVIGFILGCILLFVLDKVVPHLHKNDETTEEGVHPERYKKRTKFFLAVTMHNIPEGLAVGLALSLAITFNTDAYILSALSLAIAIGIQNVPEGAAVSIPMLEDGVKKPKAFLYGFFSGLVEPIAALLTLLLASFIPLEIMPWLLSFAAGAMIFVTVEELIPDIKNSKDYHFGMWAFIVGFLVMMSLELLL